MGRYRKFKKNDVLAAIEGSNGIVTNVAKHLKCNWHTADEYIKKWPETVQALADENEKYLDLAESKCIERINAGDGQMIRFVLATKGKRRGYTSEELNAAGNDGAGDTELNINVTGGEVDPVKVE